MIVTFNFKVLGAPIYINNSGEIEEDGYEVIDKVKYDWDVPQYVIDEVAEYLIDEFDADPEDVFDMDGYGDEYSEGFETFSNEAEYYILENYEDEAYNDYQGESKKNE